VGQKRMICFIVFSIVSWASLGNSDGKTSKLEPLTLKHQQAQDGQQVWPFFFIYAHFYCLQMQNGGGENHGSKTIAFIQSTTMCHSISLACTHSHKE
jgi:hypothetical protein